jgi:hypothetical protein
MGNQFNSKIKNFRKNDERCYGLVKDGKLENNFDKSNLNDNNNKL